jgi:hypothetical protein
LKPGDDSKHFHPSAGMGVSTKCASSSALRKRKKGA